MYILPALFFNLNGSFQVIIIYFDVVSSIFDPKKDYKSSGDSPLLIKKEDDGPEDLP
jgi:hypothetical protein